MAPASNEEQFKFLISCIRWSNNGKVDFTEVARECEIVSKGAAAKRYERMMKAHGIAPNAASIKTPPAAGSRNLKTEKRACENLGSAAKKRKMEAFSNDTGTEDDVEDYEPSDPFLKTDPEQLVVKEEMAPKAFEQMQLSDFMHGGYSSNSEDAGGYGGQNFGEDRFEDASSYLGNDEFPFASQHEFGVDPAQSYLSYGGQHSIEPNRPATATSQITSSDPIIITD